MQHYKYFIEIAQTDDINDYILQSEVFDTKTQAIEWRKSITYCRKDYKIRLMRIELDRETGIYYIDIDFVKYI